MARGKARSPAPCPECGAPTNLGGRFCRACGWDADLVETEDSHLDGVDVPQGWGPDEEAAEPAIRGGRWRWLWILLALLALGGFVRAFVI